MWLISVKERSLVRSLDVCVARDHLDAFPQSIVNNSCTIFRRMAQVVCVVYALVIHLMLLH